MSRLVSLSLFSLFVAGVRYQRFTWPLLAASLALALAGCASLEPTHASLGSQAHEYRGRMMLIAPDRAAVSLRFYLRLDTQSGELLLSDALGLTSASATWDDQGARVQRGGQERRYDDFTAMSQALLGQPLPPQALTHWMAGEPMTAQPEQLSDGFSELGWRVQRLEESEHTRVLQLSRLSEPTRRLRLAVDKT